MKESGTNCLCKFWRKHFFHNTEEERGWSDGNTMASSVQPAGFLPRGQMFTV